MKEIFKISILIISILLPATIKAAACCPYGGTSSLYQTINLSAVTNCTGNATGACPENSQANTALYITLPAGTYQFAPVGCYQYASGGTSWSSLVIFGTASGTLGSPGTLSSSIGLGYKKSNISCADAYSGSTSCYSSAVCVNVTISGQVFYFGLPDDICADDTGTISVQINQFNCFTPTVTSTSSSTPTNTPSITLTNTETITETSTITPTKTATPTATPSSTITQTSTETSSSTITGTSTQTMTSTATRTNTPSPTATASFTATASYSPSPTFSVSPTITPTFSISPTFTVTPTALPDNPAGKVEILGVYPHPIPASGCVFAVKIPVRGALQIKIYTLKGETLTTINETFNSAGTYEVPWDARNYAGNSVSFGSYFVQATMEGIGSNSKAGKWISVVR